jgi:hypothetical protein
LQYRVANLEGPSGLAEMAASDGQMLLPEYTMIHREAKLSEQDVALLCGWAAGTNAPRTLPPVSKSRNQEE